MLAVVVRDESDRGVVSGGGGGECSRVRTILDENVGVDGRAGASEAASCADCSARPCLAGKFGTGDSGLLLRRNVARQGALILLALGRPSSSSS